MSDFEAKGEISQTPAPRYELTDKDGKPHGRFGSMIESVYAAMQLWPDQTQDEDRTGKGWDIQITGRP